MTTTQHPWQEGSAKLISHAIEHMHEKSDFDDRIAFLLLDAGVETVFKIYLTSREITRENKIEYEGGKKTVNEWEFDKLVDSVEIAAGKRLKDINLKHIKYYHKHRNKLYHEEDGITIRPRNVREYATLAVKLLERLLEVDLSEELRAPEIAAKLAAELDVKRTEEERAYQSQIQTLQAAVKEVDDAVELVIEELYPQLVRKSFQREFPEIAKFKSANRSAGPESLSPDMQRNAQRTFARIPARHIHLLGVVDTLDELYVQILDELRTVRESEWWSAIQSAKEFLERVKGGTYNVYAMIGEDNWEHDIEISEEEYRDHVVEKVEHFVSKMNEIQVMLQGWTSQLRSMDETEKSNRIRGDNESQADIPTDWREVWRAFLPEVDSNMF